jgi:SM-20-related protein
MSRWCSNQLSYAPKELRILANKTLRGNYEFAFFVTGIMPFINLPASLMTNLSPSIEESIAEELAVHGYAITPDFITPTEVDALIADLHRLQQSGEMRSAGIGKNAEVTQSVRGDFIHWLEAATATPAQQNYLQRLEQLRQAVNQTLYLGLFDFEGHFASYPPGAIYRKHLDQFQQDSLRTLTAILYLNRDWQAADGGQLRIYLEGEDESVYRDIQPVAGTLVTFLSARYWHEVLPATRERLSVTGWFRTRPLQSVI